MLHKYAQSWERHRWHQDGFRLCCWVVRAARRLAQNIGMEHSCKSQEPKTGRPGQRRQCRHRPQEHCKRASAHPDATLGSKHIQQHGPGAKDCTSGGPPQFNVRHLIQKCDPEEVYVTERFSRLVPTEARPAGCTLQPHDHGNRYAFHARRDLHFPCAPPICALPSEFPPSSPAF